MEPATVSQESVARAYDWDRVSPCFAIIDTIARYEKEETTRIASEFRPALQDTLNVDALETLIESRPPVSVSFTYRDYEVQITGETVVVSSQESASG